MKDFKSSVRFKILVGLLTVMLGFMIMAVYTGGTASFFSQAVSFVVTPIQRVSASIAGSVGDFFDKFLNAGDIYEQNELLRQELTELRRQLVDYETYRHENEQLRELLGVKESGDGLQYDEVVTASVTSREPTERFYSFQIDKGYLDGISRLDPVMTAEGLVGYISEVGANYARVSTILDVSVDVGVYDASTRDVGIVSGTVDLAFEGRCIMEYLPRESEIAEGNIILTSGGSLFPRDIIVGTVVEVGPNAHGTSLAAVIQPAADVRTVKNVIVITQFEGQGES